MSGGSAKVTIRRAVAEEGQVVVTWGDGHHSRYHAAWLRHALDTSPPGRLDGGPRRSAPRAGGKARIESVEINSDGDLEVTWQSDPSVTRHRAAWLREHCYSAQERARRRRPLQLWDAGIAGRLPRSDYGTLREDATALLTLYEQVLDYGFALLRDVPAHNAAVLDVAELFGLVSPTPYADDSAEPRLEDVRIDHRVPVNTRKSDFLGPHTDTCWRTSLSGLIYLHCLKAHGSGGETFLVDGFALGERLRTEAPDCFSTLSEIPLNFASKVSNGDDWRARGRVISLGPDGEVCGLRFSAPSIHQLDLPEALIEPVLRALERFEALLYDETLWLRMSLSPGDLLVLDNQRVLHGRTAFDPDAGDRHLQTCSTRRDEFHNRYRHLARRCGREDWNRDLSWGVI
jgi:gamma-butyrobetaine dioxygenase